MKLLIIEDNHLLGNSLKKGFNDLGWTVNLVRDGEEGLYALENGHYQVAIIDHLLPKMMGMDIITEVRKKNNCTPIVMMTALGATEDRIKGLDNGADDYIVKPFDFLELVARVKALFRRSVGKGNARLSYGRLNIDLDKETATIGDVDIDLTVKEFDLLLALSEKPGHIRSRNDLTSILYELNEEPESNSLDVLLTRLRRKLGGSGIEILNKRGRGFVFKLEEPTAQR